MWFVGGRGSWRCARLQVSHVQPALRHLLTKLRTAAWLSPNDGPSRMSAKLAIPGHALPVGLHVGLLEVSWETMHVLVVRQDSMRLSAKEVSVPCGEEVEQLRLEKLVDLHPPAR